MRLINVKTLRLHEFAGEVGRGIPPYAILSHTWGDEEVLFSDMVGVDEADPDGAKRLEWVWIDTCCIDKSSSTELSEAINSMFRWYGDSTICFAYLSDVDGDVTVGPLRATLLAPATATATDALKQQQPPPPPPQRDLLFGVDEAVLAASRWFTRGWTLQELLAPDEVVFVDRRWRELGTKRTLAGALARITRIGVDALSDDHRAGGGSGGARAWPHRYSTAQKFSWAADRQTTREEDEAYCLLGLFGVSMPLLYGEGRRAFMRLQEEILRRSDDQSIFAWSRPLDGDEPASSALRLSGLLAPSPRLFRDSSHVQQMFGFGGSGGRGAASDLSALVALTRDPAEDYVNPFEFIRQITRLRQPALGPLYAMRGQSFASARLPGLICITEIRSDEGKQNQATPQATAPPAIPSIVLTVPTPTEGTVTTETATTNPEIVGMPPPDSAAPSAIVLFEAQSFSQHDSHADKNQEVDGDIKAHAPDDDGSRDEDEGEDVDSNAPLRRTRSTPGIVVTATELAGEVDHARSRPPAWDEKPTSADGYESTTTEGTDLDEAGRLSKRRAFRGDEGAVPKLSPKSQWHWFVYEPITIVPLMCTVAGMPLCLLLTRGLIIGDSPHEGGDTAAADTGDDLSIVDPAEKRDVRLLGGDRRHEGVMFRMHKPSLVCLHPSLIPRLSPLQTLYVYANRPEDEAMEAARSTIRSLRPNPSRHDANTLVSKLWRRGMPEIRVRPLVAGGDYLVFEETSQEGQNWLYDPGEGRLVLVYRDRAKTRLSVLFLHLKHVRENTLSIGTGRALASLDGDGRAPQQRDGGGGGGGGGSGAGYREKPRPVSFYIFPDIEKPTIGCFLDDSVSLDPSKLRKLGGHAAFYNAHRTVRHRLDMNASSRVELPARDGQAIVVRRRQTGPTQFLTVTIEPATVYASPAALDVPSAAEPPGENDVDDEINANDGTLAPRITSAADVTSVPLLQRGVLRSGIYVKQSGKK